jgi:C_GCAxxG_C_C family probable redox protein
MYSNKVNLAEAMFDEGFCCAQSIFCSYAESAGVSREAALKTADAFGAGMGGMAETCGAVTGAFMAIGLKYGRTQADDQQAKEKTRALIKEFTRRFKEKYGATTCKTLLDCDISTPEGMQYAEQSGITDDRCPGFITHAAHILEQLL